MCEHFFAKDLYSVDFICIRCGERYTEPQHRKNEVRIPEYEIIEEENNERL